ncbi:MAG: hypothetical protein AAF726_18880 [Planctomycetota bacterium]
MARPAHALKTVAFALAPTALALAALEGGLALFGLGTREQNVWRGFDPSAQYIVEVPERAGYHRTQIFEGRMPEVVVPPRSERRRVLLFGGSNTGAFPGHDLAVDIYERAPEGTPPPEVFNFGRAGYGSSRVAILFEQAMVLEPDVVVLYSGHNEFVEAGFLQQLDQEWTGAIGAAVEAASHLRTYNVLVDGFAPADGGLARRSAKPEEVRLEFTRFDGQTYDETLARFEQYERNLEDMCRLGIESGATVILCTVVGNDLSAPFFSTPPDSLSEADVAEIERLEREVVELMPPSFGLIAGVDVLARPRGDVWTRRRDDPRDLPDDAEVPALRELEGRMGETNWWPHPRVWGDGVSEYLAALSDFHHGRIDDEDRARLDEASTRLERIVELCPDHAISLFRLGLIALLDGDVERGRELILLAGRYDRVPRHGNDLTNGIVRDVAARVPGVHLLDLARSYRERSPDGLVGFELMQDTCHFHTAYYTVLVEDIADFLDSLE